MALAQMVDQATTTPGIAPGSWLFFLLGLVSVLGQEAEQVGVVRAGQYAVAIQGIISDGVGEAGSCLIAGVCAALSCYNISDQ